MVKQFQTEPCCDDCKFYKTPPNWFPCEPCYGGRYFEPKEPPFEPEYYSGLNWQNVPIGKKLYYSDDGEGWTETASQLRAVFKPGDNKDYRPFQSFSGLRWYFAKTCPETHAHPTITLTVNGKEWVLPKPETEEPPKDTPFWINSFMEAKQFFWQGYTCDIKLLKSGKVHLAESRAQAWADFWREAIIKVIKG